MQFDLLIDSARKLLSSFIAWLPRLAIAILTILVAMAIARGIRWAVDRALSRGQTHKNLRLAVARVI